MSRFHVSNVECSVGCIRAPSRRPPCRSERPGIRAAWGFTLLEVLAVVAIFALLVAIFLPALAGAREQARRTACLANLSNLANAVEMFAIGHQGHGQLVAQDPGRIRTADPNHRNADYQSGAYNYGVDESVPDNLYLKAWPVAYASQLGFRSLRRMEQLLANAAYDAPPPNNSDPSYYYSRFGKYDVFECPSDSSPARRVMAHMPGKIAPTNDRLYGVVSYAVNRDVFGASRGATCLTCDPWGKPWDKGKVFGSRRARLEGRLDRIIRPSEVVLFSDGGDEDAPEVYGILETSGILETRGDTGVIHGPYLENAEYTNGRLPHNRHARSKGGVCTAMADGSGHYVKPVRWEEVDAGGTVGLFVSVYSPRVRVSPYEVGELGPLQP